MILVIFMLVPNNNLQGLIETLKAISSLQLGITSNRILLGKSPNSARQFSEKKNLVFCYNINPFQFNLIVLVGWGVGRGWNLAAQKMSMMIGVSIYSLSVLLSFRTFTPLFLPPTHYCHTLIYSVLLWDIASKLSSEWQINFTSLTITSCTFSAYFLWPGADMAGCVAGPSK